MTTASGTDSELVSFKEAEDLEDAPIILYAAIVVVIIIATIIFTRVSASKLNANEQIKDYDEQDIETEAESSETAESSTE